MYWPLNVLIMSSDATLPLDALVTMPPLSIVTIEAFNPLLFLASSLSSWAFWVFLYNLWSSQLSLCLFFSLELGECVNWIEPCGTNMYLARTWKVLFSCLPLFLSFEDWNNHYNNMNVITNQELKTYMSSVFIGIRLSFPHRWIISMHATFTPSQWRHLWLYQ
jgi:hypothetical protein